MVILSDHRRRRGSDGSAANNHRHMTSESVRAEQESVGSRMRLTVAGALAWLLWTLTMTDPVGAEPRRFRVQVDIAKTTIITGSKPAVARVRLTEAGSLSLRQDLRRKSGPNPSVGLEGKGRFIGVVITDDPPKPGALTLLLGRFAGCIEVACDPQGDVMNVVYPFDAGTSLILDPGDYRLYLVTDGAPVRVTLNFDTRSLPDKALIRPEAPVHLDLGNPDERSPATPTRSFYSAGSLWEMTNPGLVISSLWLQMDGSSDDADQPVYGECSYRDAPPVPEPIAYLPQCASSPPAMGAPQISEVEEDAGSLYVRAVRPWVEAGTFAYGFWYTSPKPVTSSGSAAAFISFN